jgi:hypothetical protein
MTMPVMTVMIPRRYYDARGKSYSDNDKQQNFLYRFHIFLLLEQLITTRFNAGAIFKEL